MEKYCYTPPVLVAIPIHPIIIANATLPMKINFGLMFIGSGFGYNLAGLGILANSPDADFNN